MSIDPATAIMIFEMVEKTADLLPEVAEIIRRAKTGEPVTTEEIKQAMSDTESVVDDWDNS